MMNAFLLNSGTRQGCLLSSLLLSVALEALATAVRQEKVIKDIRIRREDVKLSLFTIDTILYTENPNVSAQKNISINNFSKISKYKINI